MKYIYDIVLNFQDNYYEFFEWKRKDKIKNIPKISLYRVSSKDILILKNNKVIIDKDTLNKITDNNKENKRIICLVSNTKTTIGLLFDKTGSLLKKSSLIYEEETEANNFAKNLEITPINYLKKEKQPHINKSRIESEKKELLKSYLNNIEDIKTLKYLYFEYYNQECNDISKIKKYLRRELNKPWSKKHDNLYQTIKLLTKNNLPTK